VIGRKQLARLVGANRNEQQRQKHAPEATEGPALPDATDAFNVETGFPVEGPEM
jgi:hypothetical protein